MSQKSITTTSFIVSSDESLNKPLPSSSSLCSSMSSSSQSTYISNTNTSTSDSIRMNQCMGYPNIGDMSNIRPQKQAGIKQSPRLSIQTHTYSSMCEPPPPPPPPPPTCPDDAFYGCLNTNNDDNNGNAFSSHSTTNNNNQQVSINSRSPSKVFSTGAFNAQRNVSNLSTQSSILNDHSPIDQRNASNNSVDKRAINDDALMPINVKSMLLHGVTGDEVLKNWLSSIKCEEYLKNFVDNGYDLHIITRMTPQDLTAIGCKTPTLRKKLLLEIKRLNIEDDIPSTKPDTLDEWLKLLRLSQYYNQLCNEGYDSIEKVCTLTWEDLEEIGITTLGHQKRLLMGIEKLQKSAQRLEEQRNDNSIYDVHPNHRISLNGDSISDSRFGAMNRVRSGFFQRSSANLDRRGMPVATVMPALKHVNSAIVTDTGFIKNNGSSNHNESLCDQNNIYNNREQVVKMSELTTTLKRTNPPLPPVRVDSLKKPSNDCQSIYGNSFSVVASNGNPASSVYQTTATSFLRTPKLGTLTATTNKMLTVGGHIQTIDQPESTTQQVRPIREAPLPPTPVQSTMKIPEKIVEEGTFGNTGVVVIPTIQSNGDHRTTAALCDTTNSLIGHQLASADEFPPPPPCQ